MTFESDFKHQCLKQNSSSVRLLQTHVNLHNLTPPTSKCGLCHLSPVIQQSFSEFTKSGGTVYVISFSLGKNKKKRNCIWGNKSVDKVYVTLSHWRQVLHLASSILPSKSQWWSTDLEQSHVRIISLSFNNRCVHRCDVYISMARYHTSVLRDSWPQRIVSIDSKCCCFYFVLYRWSVFHAWHAHF